MEPSSLGLKISWTVEEPSSLLVLNLEEKIIKSMNYINNTQVGWLEMNYLSNRLRICRADKGNLIALKIKSQ